jgi:Predicted Na+-dependent transporter
MNPWLSVFAAVFTAAVMFSAAAAAPPVEIRRILTERKLLLRAFLVNVVVVPAVAAVLFHAFHTEDFAVGAVLAAICPGAPFGTYFASRSNRNVALAMVLTCGLTIVALVSTPITSRFIFGADRMVALPEGLGLLLAGLIILLPVFAGQALHRRLPAIAARVARAAHLIAIPALVAASVAAAGMRSRGVRGMGWAGSALVLSLVVISMAAGWLAARSRDTRTTLATSTGLRNAGFAYLFAGYSFPGTDVELGVAAYSILMLIPNFAFTAVMRRGQSGTRA